MDFTEISGTPFEAPHAPHVLTQVPPPSNFCGKPRVSWVIGYGPVLASSKTKAHYSNNNNNYSNNNNKNT